MFCESMNNCCHYQSVLSVNILRNEHAIFKAGLDEPLDPLDSLSVADHIDRPLELVVRQLYAKQVILTVAAEGGKL